MVEASEPEVAEQVIAAAVAEDARPAIEPLIAWAVKSFAGASSSGPRPYGEIVTTTLLGRGSSPASSRGPVGRSANTTWAECTSWRTVAAGSVTLPD